MRGLRAIAISAVFGAISLSSSMAVLAQEQQAPQSPNVPQFQVDPFAFKPLPDHLVSGKMEGVCVDAQDHVFTVNQPLTEITGKYELDWNKILSPPVVEFDSQGNVVNSWGNRDAMPRDLHGCFVDSEGNFWVAGQSDGIVQKYTHDGSKLLLQIGTKGLLDTSDGTVDGAPLNSSHTLLNKPTEMAVDPSNGDVYISDGYGNKRVIVFDREGHYLRQWGRQGTKAEVEAGVGGVFMKAVHNIKIGPDGLVYVSDRNGNRVEVFDKMGNFRRNLLVKSEPWTRKGVGSACGIGFSQDPGHKFVYISSCGDDEIRILDSATGQVVSTIGRPGHQVGELYAPHMMAVDSKGDIIVAERVGERIQMFRFKTN
jgi:hypothetical protein